MKINWQLRLKNKATLTAVIMTTLSFIYQILSLLGITPVITENESIAVAGLVINGFAMLGIVTDPTTSGLADSEQALSYQSPKTDTRKGEK